MNNTNSVLFYFGIILTASFLGTLSQTKFALRLSDKYSLIRKNIFPFIERKFFFLQSEELINQNKKNYHVGILVIAFILLTIPVALRYYTGADYESYVRVFNEIKEHGIRFMMQQGGVEVGYIFLNRFCQLAFGNVQSVFILMAFLTNFFIYKGITYESNKIHLGIAIFVYGFALYFWGYIIIRNMLGIAIIFYALRFLFERKLLKYFISVFIACLFHKSLIIFFIIGFLYMENFKRFRMYIPISALIIISLTSKMIGMYGNLITSNLNYLNQLKSFSIQLGMTVYIPVFWLIFFSIFYKKLKELNDHNSLYYSFFFISVILSLYSISTPIITRFIYALLPAQVILLSSMLRLFDKKLLMKIVFILILFALGLNEIKHIVFEPTYYLLPYKSFIGIK